jgi:hypothetical protein
MIAARKSPIAVARAGENVSGSPVHTGFSAEKRKIPPTNVTTRGAIAVYCLFMSVSGALELALAPRDSSFKGNGIRLFGEEAALARSGNAIKHL